MQGDCLDAMQQLRQQGKIRYWGLSLNTFQPRPRRNTRWSTVLPRLSAGAEYAQPAGAGIAGKIGRQRVWVIARMPLQFGLLTGKI